MRKDSKAPARPLFLGIEGGATRTVALLVDGAGHRQQRVESGPGNVRLLTDAQMVRHFREIARAMPRPTALAIGLAGARTDKDRQRIHQAATRVWPGVPCYATHDLETALEAAEVPAPPANPPWTDNPAGKARGEPPAGRRSVAQRAAAQATQGRRPGARVLVLSGTGSCCYGRSFNGKTAKIGGWGQVLGDRGSGYHIAVQALQRVVDEWDRTGYWPPLGQRLLRALQLNEPDAFIGWVQSASKAAVAALAPEVFAAERQGDPIASNLLSEAARGLARDAVACAMQLIRQAALVQFILAGGVLLKQPDFAKRVTQELGRLWPGAWVTPLKRESAWGAVELARRLQGRSTISQAAEELDAEPGLNPPISDRADQLEHSPTEQRNPRSMNLDRLPLAMAIELMLSEDAFIPQAIRAERQPIARVIRRVARAFRRGGRLFYVGAGTSGRLGVLDASECPPTFRTPPDQVQGIIAGGQRALWESVEGAEDDADAGARSLGFRGVGSSDVVIGIAASGRTPFVLGAIGEAKRRGAGTVLITFNRFLEWAPAGCPDIIIAPAIGPEVLTGSTRLKAGTATKLILNIISTLAMVQMGKVASNLMVDLHPANTKLRDRAVRILMALAGVDSATARAVLERSDWVIKAAWGRLRKGKRRSRSSD